MKRLAMVITCMALVAGSSSAATVGRDSSSATATPTAKPTATTTATSTATTTATTTDKPTAKRSTPAKTASAKPAKRASTKPAAASAATGDVTPPKTAEATQDSAYTLKGGQEGTVFKSLTVEGEDRIRFDIERPPVRMDLDPDTAPGLDWGSAQDVLDRTVPDLSASLLATSAHDPSPWIAHPWLTSFASGAVARFRPDLKGVESWKLTIVNARGEAVASYQGHGEPPREIAWDGRSAGGAPVVPGLTYSYVLEAHDKAGNKRNFVGEGFKVSAYRLDTPNGPTLAFSGLQLPSQDPRRPATADVAATGLLIEAASWLNQAPNPARPIRVTATARTMDQAQSLAASVAKQIAPRLIGDPSRLQTTAEVRPDAPEGGNVVIACLK
jgi:hypothetical protein